MKASLWANFLGVNLPSNILDKEAEFPTSCQAFQPDTKTDNTFLEFTEYIPAGTNLSLPFNDASCARPSQFISVDLCRIALLLETSNRSVVSTEVWLPRNWSGRFLGTGNGGIDGCIKYEDLEYGAVNGFAVVGSNNGHNGTAGDSFYQNAEVLRDFAWRALHLSVVAGKEATRLFYGRPHTKSYFSGCSFGGRQGVFSAERFPGDFDGIIAGAPAVDFNNLVSWRAGFFPTTGSTGSIGFIEPYVWKGLIHAEVLKQCDMLDGVGDGIIEDPRLCNFSPEAVMCTKERVNNCLNPDQAEVVRKVFSPMYGEDGRTVFPAMQPGSELEAAENLYTGKPFSYSKDWFKYVVYDPSWNPANFDIHDAKVADSLNPENIKTWPDSLSQYAQRGGKMIVFHGQQDGKITSFNTERFYNHLSQGMGTSPSELDDFFRFFRIPGMSHCGSGPGAWAFGQGGKFEVARAPFRPSENILAALVAWVELGLAPDTVRGTKYVNDSLELGVGFRRDHCRYPLRSSYTRGDQWRCVSSEPLKKQ
ncbi:Tannase/feruloyl esterase [Aspergillus alliaceus]|uniref:Tannase/feruloyl esterase n=1 Tax=Petromyces alliaceus TaxID=209559 RepID=UPI0012A5B433|nr:Tannase/feruloyl esterase [Aspergillus alliaceus]KAB8239067.1 Tannase/feruloyl esterase [Aspergillus alliaceus]